VDDPFEERRCFECGTKTKVVMVKPKEIVVCSKGICGAKARRTSLADAWVTVTRAGEQMNTTYNFSPGDIEPLPEALKGLKPVDFAHDPEFQPLSAGEQAAALGIVNPYRDVASTKEEDEDEDIPFDKASVKDDKDTDANIFRR
jgi:hypothetical protein